MNIRLLVISLGLAALAACNTVDQALDCAHICNRYADCFDENYDVGTCDDRCRENAKDDQDFADAASNCESCIDDKSCSGSFSCTSECIGVVP